MINKDLATTGIYKELSLRQYELKWLKRREPVLKLAKICQQSSRHQQLAKRLLQCGNLHFGYDVNGQLKFVNVSHCRSRPCPECQIDRQRQYINKFRNWIGSFLQQYPNDVFIYLTVGYKNVVIGLVSQMNKQLHAGLARLFRRANTKVIIEGSITFFHFTISNNAHIHFDTHSIIAFAQDRCGADKYRQRIFWADLIQKDLNLIINQTLMLKQ